MIEILISILFGVVEGITEWLPISSTGHMILLNKLVPFNVTADFYSMYEVVIQLGAILAVIVIFFNKLFPFGKSNQPLGDGVLTYVKKDIFVLWLKIIVSCIPAAIIGIFFDDFFEALFYNPTSVAIALIVFGVGFILIENYHKDKESKVNSLADITFKTAIIIGLFQVLAAIFPGTSRSGATILGALLIGVSRTVAAEFTFYEAIPVMFGASLLKLVKFGFSFTNLEILILVFGMLTAFIVSMFAIKYLMAYVKKHDFKIFGYYRIILGIVVLLYFGI